MKSKYGNVRRTFIEGDSAKVFDRETRMVMVDLQDDTQTSPTMTEAVSASETSETEATETSEATSIATGKSGFQVQIDPLLDYGHVKSQLIEAAYPQKEEFAILFNVVNALLHERSGETLTEAEQADIAAFGEMQQWRELCAEAAAQVIKN